MVRTNNQWVGLWARTTWRSCGKLFMIKSSFNTRRRIRDSRLTLSGLTEALILWKNWKGNCSIKYIGRVGLTPRARINKEKTSSNQLSEAGLSTKRGKSCSQTLMIFKKVNKSSRTFIKATWITNHTEIEPLLSFPKSKSRG